MAVMPRSDCNYKRKGLNQRRFRKQVAQELARSNRQYASKGHEEKSAAAEDKTTVTAPIKKPGFSRADEEVVNFKDLPKNRSDQAAYLRNKRGLPAIK